MNQQSLKSKALNGFVWTSFEKFGNQFIQLVLGIVIARILSPDDYGIIGMTAIFTALAATFLDSGFGSALIRKKDRNEADFSTCFYFNIAMGALMYALMFLGAPFIAEFYRTPLLTPVCRVIGLTFIINAMTIAQTAKLTAELRFRELSGITVAANLLSGLVGLVMAYSGFGVWALVAQMLGGSVLRLLLIEISTKWVPHNTFSKDSFRYLFSFGSRILCSSLINTVYSNLYTLVIGRAYTTAEVGHYNRANQFATLPSQSVLETVMKVAYPVMSEVQDDPEKLASAYKKFLRLPLFALYPVLAGMIALGYPMIEVLLGTKWLPCVPFLQILSVGAMFAPLTHINLNILYVKGRTDLVLKLEIIKKTIAFTILFVTLQFGIFWLLVGKAFYDLIAYSINCYYTSKFINFGFYKQLYYNLPIIIKSAAMGVVCHFSTMLVEAAWLKLLIGTIIGIFFYCVLLWITKDESLRDIIQILRHSKK